MSKVIMLQNAWSPVWAGREWPRESWLNALAKCPTGRRMRVLTGSPGLNECWNTTPICGPTASSRLDADLGHVARVLAEVCPDVVACCGLQAIDAVRQVWRGQRLELPHPTARWVKDDLYIDAGVILKLMERGVITNSIRIWEQKGENYRAEVIK